MSDHFQTHVSDAPAPDLFRQFPPLPSWLADRLLRADEKVTWVRGPRYNPPWERYVTHPALLLVALALGASCVAAGWLAAGPRGALLLAALPGVAVVIGTLFLVGFASGYFTRLVVTNSRVVILQGYEVCRTWGVDNLPRFLVRYGEGEGGARAPSVDVDAVQTIFGSSSDQFVDAKTILSFGKTLDQIKTREDRRP
jgi:hypothetical protein